jgi:hypothetical protein
VEAERYGTSGHGASAKHAALAAEAVPFAEDDFGDGELPF